MRPRSRGHSTRKEHPMFHPTRRMRRALRVLAVAATATVFAAGPVSAAFSISINDASGDTRNNPMGLGDGTSSSTDLKNVTFAGKTVNGQERLAATWTVEGSIPPEGSTNPLGFDGPSPIYNGGSYFLMFQNRDKQHN